MNSSSEGWNLGPDDDPNGSRSSALSILAILAAGQGPMTIAEIAGRTTLHRVSLYRNLESLVDEGWIRCDGTPRRYWISFQFMELGLRAFRHHGVRDALLPIIIQLCQTLGNTIPCITVYDQGMAIMTDYVELIDGVPVPVAQAKARWAPATPSVYPVLAELSRDELDEAYRFRPPSVPAIDRAELEAVLERTRSDGYARVFDWVRPGLGALSVPVRDRAGRVVAGLAILLRSAEQPTPIMLEKTLDAGERASARLGYRQRIGPF